MQHAGSMCRAEGTRHLDPDRGDVGPGQRALVAEAVGQRARVEVLHGQPGPALDGRTRVVDGDDVRVPRQASHGTTLVLEALTGPIVDVVHGQDLEGHHALEAPVLSAVHDTEPALRQTNQIGVTLDRGGCVHGVPLPPDGDAPP